MNHDSTGPVTVVPAPKQVFPVDAVDALGRTPLMHATFAKSAEAVVWLVHRKAALKTLGAMVGWGWWLTSSNDLR